MTKEKKLSHLRGKVTKTKGRNKNKFDDKLCRPGTAIINTMSRWFLFSGVFFVNEGKNAMALTI